MLMCSYTQKNDDDDHSFSILFIHGRYKDEEEKEEMK